MNTTPPVEPALVPGRSCDDCAMCCKLLEIKALEKPAQQWCTHCVNHSSCGIYETRPTPCHTFFCGWRLYEGMGDEWKPSVARMMVRPSEGDHLFVQLDASRPDAWRKQPYYGQLKNWARANNPQGRQVIISLNNRYTIVFPDREVDIGEVTAQDNVRFEMVQTPQGMRTEVFKTRS